jgi:hypothetical protein
MAFSPFWVIHNSQKKTTSSNENDSYWNSVLRTYQQSGETIHDPSGFYHYKDSYEVDFPTKNTAGDKANFAGGSRSVIFPSDVSTFKESANLLFDEDYIEIYFFEDGTAELGYWVYETEGYLQDPLIYKRIQMSSRAVGGGEPLPPPTQGGDTKPPANRKWETIPIPDTSNLVIYNTGWIGIGGSKVKGEITLIAEEGVGFWEDITYVNPEKDILGIICNDWIEVWTYYDEIGDIEVHASLLSLHEGLWIDDYNVGGPRGNLIFFGSVCMAYPGISGLVDSSGKLLSGYKTKFKYDTRLTGYAPPNYPPTGNLQIMYIEDLGAIAD